MLTDDCGDGRRRGLASQPYGPDMPTVLMACQVLMYSMKVAQSWHKQICRRPLEAHGARYSEFWNWSKVDSRVRRPAPWPRGKYTPVNGERWPVLEKWLALTRE